MKSQDVVIIGGGVGGLVTASVAGQLGLSVTLIEAEGKLGGDCLHYGCVPSKALIEAARVVNMARRSTEFGLPEFNVEQVNLANVLDHVRGVIAEIQKHDDPERFRRYGCDVIFGHARFVARDTVTVNDKTIKGRRFVIATGSHAFVPEIPGLDEVGYLTNREIFSLQKLPSRLAVIGGGAIGIEMAQAFSRLGSKVTVVQKGEQILPREDRETAETLTRLMRREGIEFLFNAEMRELRHGDAGDKRIIVQSGDGETTQLDVDEVVLAIGRRPTVADLGLENAGVEYSERGIEVDRRLRTTNPNIYACGDVVGSYQFTHVAEYQAGIVIANVVFRLPKKLDYQAIPWVTYSDPELARVGMTKAEADEAGIPCQELRFPFADVDRAIAEREEAGFVKVVIRKGSRWRGGGRILGATLLGSHAGELLPEFVLAIRKKANIGDISAAIHAYPTRAQINRRVVNTYFGAKLFSPSSRRLVRWLQRLIP